ncbi:MAG: Uncharacterized MFS-type transporter, partial [uncultured Solirubrobacteraceae bacterium]
DVPRHSSSEEPGAAPAGADAVHDRGGRVHRERRPPLDRPRARVLPREPLVGHQRVHPRLRRLPAARRPHGRPARPPPPVHARPRRLLDRVARRRPGVQRRHARRRPRLPGPGRRPRLPRRALHRHHDVRRGRRAQPRARRLGRRGRRRRRCRRPPRRRADRVPRLGVGPVGQRADRRARDLPGPPAAAREPRRGRAPHVRPARRLHGDRRPRPARLHDRGRRERGLDLGPDARPGCRRPGADRHLPRHRVAHPCAAHAAGDLPAADAARGERRRPAHRHVAVLDVLLHLAVPPGGAGLQRAGDGPGLPPAVDLHHPVGGRGLPARDAAGLQAAADRGARPHRDRAAVVLARGPGRLLRRGRPVPLPDRGRRPRVLLRPRDDRGRDRDEPGRGGPGVGAHQHLPADRRRARRGDPRLRGQLGHERLDPGQPGRRAHGGLPGRVPRGRGLRRGRRDPHAGAHLEQGLARDGGEGQGRRGPGRRGGL